MRSFGGSGTKMVLIFSINYDIIFFQRLKDLKIRLPGQKVMDMALTVEVTISRNNRLKIYLI